MPTLFVTNKELKRFLSYTARVRSLNVGYLDEHQGWLAHVLVSFLGKIVELMQLRHVVPFSKLQSLHGRASLDSTIPMSVAAPLFVTNSLQHLNLQFYAKVGHAKGPDLVALLEHIAQSPLSLQTLEITAYSWKADDAENQIDENQLLGPAILSQKSIRTLIVPAVKSVVSILPELSFLRELALDMTWDHIEQSWWSYGRLLELNSLERLTLVSKKPSGDGLAFLQAGSFSSLAHFIFSNTFGVASIINVLAKKYKHVLKLTIKAHRVLKIQDVEPFTQDMGHLRELDFALGSKRYLASAEVGPDQIKASLRSLPNLEVFRIRHARRSRTPTLNKLGIDIFLACIEGGANLKTLELSLNIQALDIPATIPRGYFLPNLQNLFLPFSHLPPDASTPLAKLLIRTVSLHCLVTPTIRSEDRSMDRTWKLFVSLYTMKKSAMKRPGATADSIFQGEAGTLALMDMLAYLVDTGGPKGDPDLVIGTLANARRKEEDIDIDNISEVTWDGDSDEE